MDILGFKNLVKNSPDKAAEIMTKIKNNFSKGISDSFIQGIEFKYIIVSDSIVVTCKELEPIYKFVGMAQCLLLRNGYLVKGCINYGSIYHEDETVIVGEAYQEAYWYQEEILKDPFVVFYPGITANVATTIEKLRYTCLNYLKYLLTFMRSHSGTKPTNVATTILNYLKYIPNIDEKETLTKDTIGKIIKDNIKKSHSTSVRYKWHLTNEYWTKHQSPKSTEDPESNTFELSPEKLERLITCTLNGLEKAQTKYAKWSKDYSLSSFGPEYLITTYTCEELDEYGFEFLPESSMSAIMDGQVGRTPAELRANGRVDIEIIEDQKTYALIEFKRSIKATSKCIQDINRLCETLLKKPSIKFGIFGSLIDHDYSHTKKSEKTQMTQEKIEKFVSIIKDSIEKNYDLKLQSRLTLSKEGSEYDNDKGGKCNWNWQGVCIIISRG